MNITEFIRYIENNFPDKKEEVLKNVSLTDFVLANQLKDKLIKKITEKILNQLINRKIKKEAKED